MSSPRQVGTALDGSAAEAEDAGCTGIAGSMAWAPSRRGGVGRAAWRGGAGWRGCGMDGGGSANTVFGCGASAWRSSAGALAMGGWASAVTGSGWAGCTGGGKSAASAAGTGATVSGGGGWAAASGAVSVARIGSGAAALDISGAGVISTAVTPSGGLTRGASQSSGISTAKCSPAATNAAATVAPRRRGCPCMIGSPRGTPGCPAPSGIGQRAWIAGAPFSPSAIRDTRATPAALTRPNTRMTSPYGTDRSPRT